MNEDDYQIYYADAKLAAEGILDALGYEHCGVWLLFSIKPNNKVRFWHPRFLKHNTQGTLYYELRQNGRKHYIWEIEIANTESRYNLLETVNINLLNTPQENIDLVLLSRL